MQFNSLIDGKTIIMDAPQRAGGEENRPIPKPLILTALSGCTGMDVVALLRKATITIHDLSINVTGELNKQAPIQYTSIHIQYIFKAAANTLETVLNAVNDSQEKYCGVSCMLKKVIPITWEIDFNGVAIFNNKKAAMMASQNIKKTGEV